jgi:hypothetical protein
VGEGEGEGEGPVPGVGVGVALVAGWELAEVVEEPPFPPHEASNKDNARIAEHV